MFEFFGFIINLWYVPLYQSMLSLSGSCPWMDSRIEGGDARPEKTMDFDIVDKDAVNFKTGLYKRAELVLTEEGTKDYSLCYW